MAEKIRAFVCGHPVAHSLSPAIHGYWLQKYQINGSYEKVDVGPDSATDFFADLVGAGWTGGNVTIPHKVTAWQACEKRDSAANAIGAVNTLWIEDGTLCGANTDTVGFLKNLDDQAPGWDEPGPAVVLGAGGAARAVVHALQERGISDIRIVNRTRNKAEDLAAAYSKGVSAGGWDNLPSFMAGAGLLVNTTSLGMAGQPTLHVDLSGFAGDGIVCDIVYVPLKTALLAAAENRGLRTVDGLGMLLHQAVPGFQRWFGIEPEVNEELRGKILELLEKRT